MRGSFSVLNPFGTFICSQLQIKNTCRHGFTYHILPLTHSIFLKGSLTWAAFCLASSICLWLSRASCSALIFQRAKSRSWRCCCAYRSGKQVLTIQVKHEDVICFSHWLKQTTVLKIWIYSPGGVSSAWNRIFNPLTLFLFEAMHIPRTLPPQCRKDLGDQLIQQTRINILVSIRKLQPKILFLWNKTNHPRQTTTPHGTGTQHQS